jgi:hypothetical protein
MADPDPLHAVHRSRRLAIAVWGVALLPAAGTVLAAGLGGFALGSFLSSGDSGEMGGVIQGFAIWLGAVAAATGLGALLVAAFLWGAAVSILRYAAAKQHPDFATNDAWDARIYGSAPAALALSVGLAVIGFLLGLVTL